MLLWLKLMNMLIIVFLFLNINNFRGFLFQNLYWQALLLRHLDYLSLLCVLKRIQYDWRLCLFIRLLYLYLFGLSLLIWFLWKYFFSINIFNMLVLFVMSMLLTDLCLFSLKRILHFMRMVFIGDNALMILYSFLIAIFCILCIGRNMIILVITHA